MESISTAPDGGLVVAGISSSFSAGGDGDALVVKLNPDGSVAWAKTYGGAGEDMALDIKAAPDGGYIMAGWTESFGAGQSDCWLLKLDADGNVQWSKAFGGPGMEQAVYADPLPSGGYVVAGATTSFGAGDGDYWVLKIDSAGGVVWQKAYGGPLGDAPPNEYGEQVARAVVGADGNIVVASVSFSFGKGDGDVWVLKLDAADGSPVWQYAYGDAGEDSNWMLSRATGGGYLFSGSFVDVATQDPDVWVVKLAEDGTVEWQKTYGIAGVFDEALYHIPTSDGGVLVQAYVEQTSGDDWRSLLLKLDSSGTLAWSRVYRNGPVSWPNAAVEVSDGFYVVGVGIADVSVYDQQMWVFKIDSGGAITQNCQLGTAYEPVDRVPTAIATPTTATVTDTSSLATVTDTAVDAVPVTLAPRYDCH
ncbi:MAG: hypothetical protein D6806_09250 [Deltaproteobacteria bacterium]|nr:MAG: hypothetical protein D6806_09250 [Deltaproteobacteria bacterium]